MGVTLKAVAAMAGVSTATASRVINGFDGVSPTLRSRVETAVEQLGYHGSTSARALRTQRTDTIGLVVPSLTNPYFPLLIDEANRVCHANGIRVLVASSDFPEGDAAWLARSGSVDGLVIVGSREKERDDPESEVVINVPCIGFDRRPAGLEVPTFSVDNLHGGEQVARHLLSLGHQVFGVVTGPPDVDSSNERVQAFIRTLVEGGVGVRSIHKRVGDFTEASGREAVAHMLEETRPDAIFCANDLMAIGAMRLLTRKSLRIPQDVAVVGFDGIESGRYVSPALSTYQQPTRKLATEAVEMLLRLISGEVARTDREHTTLQGHLIVRGSTKGELAVTE